MTDQQTTYTFTTTDKNQAARWLKADALCWIIWELDNQMRSDVKYNNGDLSTEHWREVLRELLEGNSIDLEEIWG